jgi:hypothetical protein
MGKLMNLFHLENQYLCLGPRGSGETFFLEKIVKSKKITIYWLRVFVTLENRNGQDLKERVICRESCRAIREFLGILWPFDLKLDVWMC